MINKGTYKDKDKSNLYFHLKLAVFYLAKTSTCKPYNVQKAIANDIR